MVTLISYGDDQNTMPLVLVGLSTDLKPISYYQNLFIMNDSVFIEIDTHIIYKYDLEHKIWYVIEGGDINDYIT
jgi:hypothetical protein